MRIAVTGSTGLVGRELTRQLAAAGHEAVPVVRRTPRSGEIGWDPAAGSMDAAGLADVDAVVHLAGEPVAGRRWNEAHKTRVLESRRRGTDAVARAVAAARADGRGPAVLLSASASGFYGDRGDEVLHEDAGRGEGFLADVCEVWEGATSPARDAGATVTTFRTGIVLSRHGGALAKQLPIFRLGGGGPLAGGDMWMPWVSRHDHARAIVHLLTADLDGPVNVCGPEPVRNREFTKALAHALRRPAVLPVPGPALRLVLGEMAAELLASARMSSDRLVASGFAFDHPTVEVALAAALAEPEA